MTEKSADLTLHTLCSCSDKSGLRSNSILICASSATSKNVQLKKEEGQHGTLAHHVRDGICVDPPLCRGPSQGTYGFRLIGLVCECETVGKIGEVDEMGERELVLVVSVRCGKERDMTRG